MNEGENKPRILRTLAFGTGRYGHDRHLGTRMGHQTNRRMK